MQKGSNCALGAMIGAALVATLTTVARAAKRRFEHVMNTANERSGDGQLNDLHGIYCNKRAGRLTVADAAQDRIQAFKLVADSSS